MTEVKLHIHISKDGNNLVTPERMQLLRLINESGSLLNASKQIGISYNKAWTLLDAMNTATSTPVLEKKRGGKGGGGARLTAFGQTILMEYEAISRMVDEFTRKLNTEINI